MPGPDPDVPTIRFSQRTLANGLRVIVAPDQLAPVVAVNLWYDVGSRHEPPGRTGFAHLFEHFMFQGSAPRRQDRAHGHRPGRRRRAATRRPTSTAPTTSRRCRRTSSTSALWLEADRMATLLDALDPGEPRQPARGGQEREAPELRQPTLRLVLRAPHRRRLPRGPSVPPHADRLDGRPRRGHAGRRAALLPGLVCAQQLRLSIVGDVDEDDRARGRRALVRTHPGATRPWPPSRAPDLAPRLGRGDPRDGPRRRAAGAHPFRLPDTALRHARPSTRSRSPARSWPAARAAGSTSASSASCAWRRT